MERDKNGRGKGGKAAAWNIKNVVPAERHENEIARYNDERFPRIQERGMVVAWYRPLTSSKDERYEV